MAAPWKVFCQVQLSTQLVQITLPSNEGCSAWVSGQNYILPSSWLVVLHLSPSVSMTSDATCWLKSLKCHRNLFLMQRREFPALAVHSLSIPVAQVCHPLIMAQAAS